jgi:hypothetical protein
LPRVKSETWRYAPDRAAFGTTAERQNATDVANA